MWRRYRIRSIGVIILSAYLSLISLPAQAGETYQLLTANSPEMTTLGPRVQGWLAAVQAADANALAEFIIPDYRDEFLRQMGTEGSRESTLFWGSAASVQTLLNSANPLRQAAFRHVDIKKNGPGATVCHYDAARLTLSVANSMQALRDTVADPTATRCFYWFEADGSWFFSHLFAISR